MKKLSAMIDRNRIVDLRGTTKKEVLQELVEVVAAAPEVTDKDDFFLSVMKRERILSTGIGIGLAVPHVNIDSVKDFVMAIGRKREGVDFKSLDNKPVYLVVMIGANSSQQDGYLKVLAKICRLFKHPRFRDKIINASGPDEIMELLSDH